MKTEAVVGTQYGEYTVVSNEVKSNKFKERMFLVQCSCGKEQYITAKRLTSGKATKCKSCASKLTAKQYGMPSSSKYVGDLGGSYFCMLKHGAYRRGYEFNITQEFAWDLFLKQNKECTLSGLPITLSTSVLNGSPAYKKFTASLDRIDNTKGYIVGNVQWVHKEINRFKNNLTEDKLIYFCNLISAKHGNQQPSTSGMV